MPTQSAPPFGTVTTFNSGEKARDKRKDKQIRIPVTSGPNSAQDLADAIVQLCAQWQEKRGEKLDMRVLGDGLRLAVRGLQQYFRANG